MGPFERYNLVKLYVQEQEKKEEAEKAKQEEEKKKETSPNGQAIADERTDEERIEAVCILIL